MEISNKNDEKDKTERCVESLLYDVLTVVFSHLTPEQVRVAATVSKSWRNEAYKNLIQRKMHINSIVLPTPECDCSITSHLDGKCNVYHRYATKIGFTPRFAIFFIDPRIDAAKVYSHYGPWLLTSSPSVPESQYGLIVECWRICDNKENLKYIFDNGTAVTIGAFVVPELNDLVKIDKFIPEMDESAEEFVDRLLPKNIEKPCFIVFETFFTSERAESIKKTLKDRYKQHRFTLWGGYVPKITLVSRNCKEFPEPQCIWLRLTGKSFITWSIVLTEDMSKCRIRRKLILLKTKMEFLVETIAFAFVPTINDGDNQTMSRVLMFKQIFPTIRLKTLLSHHNCHVNLYSFGIGSTEAGVNPLLEHKNGISILIITSM